MYRRLRNRDFSAEVWKAFVDRYYEPVRRWARQWCPDSHNADDVAQEVFIKLKDLVENPAKQPPDVHAESGSFRPFLRVIVRSLAWGSVRKQIRRAPGASGQAETVRREIPLHDQPDVARTDEDWVEDLIERWEFEDRLDAKVQEYAAALPLLRASPWYNPNTFDDFLRVFRDGVVGVYYDDVVGRSRGTTTVNANRVAKRVCGLMNWPYETDADRERTNLILREVLHRHERLPE
jgi:DNA-directed RNA polymerase specialized sigma24 family protein